MGKFWVCWDTIQYKVNTGKQLAVTLMSAGARRLLPLKYRRCKNIRKPKGRRVT